MGVAGRCLALHEAEAAEATAALDLLGRLASTGRPLAGWGYSVAEVLRPLVPAEETEARLAAGAPRAGAGTRVNRLRVELPLVALAGDWERLDVLLADARRVAGPACAPALAWIADWAEAVQRVAAGRLADALELALPATSALEAHGERYTSARLLADLLERMGDDAPAAPAARTAERLDALGAHASAASIRAAFAGR